MSSRSPFTPESAELVSQQILDDDGTGNYTTPYAIAGLIEAVLKVVDAIDRLRETINEASTPLAHNKFPDQL